MQDRLVWLLKRFELRAKVFQAGPLTCTAHAPEVPNAGYLHLLQAGRVRLVSEGGPDIEIHEPSAFFYMNPTKHRLEPLDDDVRVVCSTFEFGCRLPCPRWSSCAWQTHRRWRRPSISCLVKAPGITAGAMRFSIA